MLVQSGLQESRWAEAMECCCYLRNVPDLQADGQTPYERQFKSPFDALLPKTGQDSIKMEGQFYLVYALDIHCMRAGKGDSMVADMELEKLGSVGNPCSKTQCNGSHHVERLSKKKPHIPDRRWNSQVVWKRSGFPKIHLNSGPPCAREHNDVFFFRRIGRVSTIGQING